MITLGVLSDTHIPDRAPRLRAQVTPIFREAGVQGILHAGDVSVPRVLRQLEEIAPVYAVRGNRDWLYLPSLPKMRRLTFAGVTLGLVHGHGDLRSYLLDKIHYIAHGLQEVRYRQRVLATFPHAQVIVFGHLHYPINERVEDRLLFNPGSVCCPEKKYIHPSIGLLHIHPGGQVIGEIIELK